MFHLGTSWGISQSAVSRIITRVEDILTDSKEFALPGKRMADWSPEVEIVVVDVAESPIEQNRICQQYQSFRPVQQTSINIF